MGTLVGQSAPDFCVPAVLGTGEIVDAFQFSKAIQGRYGLLFFYPLDFTFVCPSELIALDHRMDEFRKRNVEVVGISVDSQFTHNAWRNTKIEQGGIGAVQYTLASDVAHRVCQTYGVEHPNGVALRGAFLIDKKGIVRSAIINDLPLGRNVDEILRLFDAIDFCEKYGEVCPASWKKGEQGMKANPKGVAEYLKQHGKEL